METLKMWYRQLEITTLAVDDAYVYFDSDLILKIFQADESEINDALDLTDDQRRAVEGRLEGLTPSADDSNYEYMAAPTNLRFRFHEGESIGEQLANQIDNFEDRWALDMAFIVQSVLIEAQEAHQGPRRPKALSAIRRFWRRH